jgi:hypothetical protein
MGLVAIILFLVVLWCISGFLGAWTGSGRGMVWRRAVLPLITMTIGILALWNAWMVLLMARAVVLCIGYGVPDPESSSGPRDLGSSLAMFWWKVFTCGAGYTEEDAVRDTAIATRATIGILEGLSIIIVPIVSAGSGSWVLWLWAMLFICGNNILFGALVQKEGTVKLFGADLLWEEIVIHGNDTLIITLLILACR